MANLYIVKLEDGVVDGHGVNAHMVVAYDEKALLTYVLIMPDLRTLICGMMLRLNLFVKYLNQSMTAAYKVILTGRAWS